MSISRDFANMTPDQVAQFIERLDVRDIQNVERVGILNDWTFSVYGEDYNETSYRILADKISRLVQFESLSEKLLEKLDQAERRALMPRLEEQLGELHSVIQIFTATVINTNQIKKLEDFDRDLLKKRDELSEDSIQSIRTFLRNLKDNIAGVLKNITPSSDGILNPPTPAMIEDLVASGRIPLAVDWMDHYGVTRYIIEEFLRAQKVDLVFGLAMELRNDDLRAFVARELIQVDQIDRAVEVTSRTSNPKQLGWWLREDFLNKIKTSLRKGQIQQAIERAHSLPDILKSDAFAFIAGKYAQIGEIDKAIEVSNWIPDNRAASYLIVKELSKSEKVEELIQAVEIMQQRREGNFLKLIPNLVLKLLQKDECERAHDIALLADNSYLEPIYGYQKDNCLYDIIKRLCELNRFDDAIAMLSEITAEKQIFVTKSFIIKQLFKNLEKGLINDQAEVINRATELANSSDELMKKILITELLKRNLMEKAKEVHDSILDPKLKRPCFLLIAKRYFEISPDEGFKFCKFNWEGGERAGPLFDDTLVAFIKIGEVDLVFKIIRLIPNDDFRHTNYLTWILMNDLFLSWPHSSFPFDSIVAAANLIPNEDLKINWLGLIIVAYSGRDEPAALKVLDSLPDDETKKKALLRWLDVVKDHRRAQMARWVLDTAANRISDERLKNQLIGELQRKMSN